MGSIEEYHLHAHFHESKPRAFKLAAKIVDNAFLFDHWKALARTAVGR